MEKPVENDLFRKGDVITVPFPFSDLQKTKPRPALIIAEAGTNDFITCAITSKSGRNDEVTLEDKDFRLGKLDLSPCYIRVNYIFTINRGIIRKKVGELKDEKLNEVSSKLIEILQRSRSNKPEKSKALERVKRN